MACWLAVPVGLLFAAALHEVQRLPEKSTVVTIFPDTADRYLSKESMNKNMLFRLTCYQIKESYTLGGNNHAHSKQN